MNSRFSIAPRRAAARVAARVLTLLIVTAVAVTAAPPNAQALQEATVQSRSARVVREARQAAAKPRRVESHPQAGSVSGSQSVRAAGAKRSARSLVLALANGQRRASAAHARETEQPDTPETFAEATLTPATGGQIEAGSVGVSAEFSGYKISDELQLTLSEAAPDAAASAEAQLDGIAFSDAVSIDAQAADGSEVTKFPAEVVTEKDQHGVEKAVDVTPGITLGFAVDEDEVTAAGIELTSLKLYTRESSAEDWVELPSYYDEESGKVLAESDHLSEFIVIGIKYVPPPGPRIVLDPDDDYGWADTPGPATELVYNVALANLVKSKLEASCLAPVVVTRQADVRFVDGAFRANIARAHNPVATVSIAFDALTGSAWGDADNGGTYTYTFGGAGSTLQSYLTNIMPQYTGRPANTRAPNGTFPDSAFAGLPGAMVHMETLYLDHNYDRAVIDNGFVHIANGLLVSLARYAETLGYDCSDPALEGLPAPPSAAELARWRQLGYQNYQTYGADPVSFSTGNLVESEPLFTLGGLGSQQLELGLVYNSQDGRLTRTGAGWSFGLGSRAQRFDDGSVLVVRGDGASFAFKKNGTNGYTGETGLGLTLTEAGGGVLQLKSDAGEVWRYDASDIEGIGELISQTDRQGHTITLSYGAPTSTQNFLPLTAITDAAGQKVTVQNDALGKITSFTHPDGRVWRLAYDGNQNLVSITAPDGGVRAFTYDSAHRMLSATDAVGDTYLKNEYDSAGRVVKQWDAEQNLRTFTYGNGVTTYTDNEGGQHRFEWDSRARITGITDAAGGRTEFEFDTANRVTEAIEPDGGVTKYEYDSFGNVTREIKPDGSVWRSTSTPTGELLTQTDPLGRTVTHTVNEKGLRTRTVQADGGVIDYAYTASGDLSQITWPSGAVETFGYDGRGNLTKRVSPAGVVSLYEYDTANRLVRERNAAGTVWSYEYDAADNVKTRTDALGNVSRYSYDRNGHLLAAIAPDGGTTTYTWDSLFRVASVTDAEGGTTSYRYNREDALVATIDPMGVETVREVDPTGRVTAVTDPLGGVWQAELDRAGRKVAETDAAGSTTRSNYDPAGRPTKVTDAEGGEWSYEYDAVGNLVSQTDPLGGVSTLEYDLLGRVTFVTDADERTTEFVYDADGGLIAVIDPVGAATGFKLDADGQILESTNALGETTSYDYDVLGQLASVTNPLGAVTTYGYDTAGRVTSVTDAVGGVTRYEYDPVGRQTVVVDADGNRTEQRYDLVGRVVAKVDGAGGITRYEYDFAGRQTATIDADGRVTRYEYDDAGQLVAVVEGYQAGGSTSGAGGIGARSGILGETMPVADPAPGPSGDPAIDPTADPGEDVVFGSEPRDPAGLLDPDDTASIVNVDTNVRTEYEYTKNGLLALIRNPNGDVTRYEYDRAGRPTLMRGADGVVTTSQYDLAGRVVAQTNGAGQYVKTRYTPAGVVTGYETQFDVVSFETDGAGRPIVMTDRTGVTAWRYDELGRMTAETGGDGNTTRAAYDAAGQLTELASADVRSGSSLTGGDDGIGYRVKYSYDLAGRMSGLQSSWGQTSYGYTPAGLLREIVRGDGVRTDLTHDGAGRVTSMLHAEQLAGLQIDPVADPELDADAAADAEPASLFEAFEAAGDDAGDPLDAGEIPLGRKLLNPKRDATMCAADGVASYLDGRALPNLEGEDKFCVKTRDYLKRRVAPMPNDPVGLGGALKFDYSYTPAGKVATTDRTLLEVPGFDPEADLDPGFDVVPEFGVDPVLSGGVAAAAFNEALPVSPEPVSQLHQSFSYDGLGRLVGATATQLLTDTGDPEALTQSRFVFDGAGNRLLAETATNDVVSTLTQHFGPGNKLLSSQTEQHDLATEDTSFEQRNYSYDEAGRRTGVSGAENATYGYDWRNQPTRTTDDASSTKTTYDGLGRPVSRETETAYSTEAVTMSFFGGAQLGSVSTLHGASSNVWGVFGQLAGMDAEVTGEARWALLDRLGSVVAEAGGIAGVTGADIREIASYAEFGLPSYETGGFTSPYGFTGELQDAGTGVVAFGSRSYDSGSGTWMAPDAWPGLLVQPQSLNRYAYVLGDPVTFVDVGGFAATLPNASGAANHYDYSKGGWKPILSPKVSTPNASGATNHYERNGTYWREVLTPELESMRPARHADTTRTCTSSSAMASCGPTGLPGVKSRMQSGNYPDTFGGGWADIQAWTQSDAGKATSNILAGASLLIPLLGYLTGNPGVMAFAVVIGYVAALGSTAIDCIAAPTSPKCVAGAIGASTGPIGSITTRLPKHTTLMSTVVKNTLSIVGYETTALGWLITFGEWYEEE